MAKKLRVGVIFGGESGEHEVSLASAASVLAAIDRERFEPVPIGITREGRWLVGGDPMRALADQAARHALGEGGTIQGLLELAGVPYVGAGVLASAVGMDKAAMKDMFREHGLPIVDYVLVKRHEWRREPAAVERAVGEALGFPCFVKPANLGSSVGISKVKAAEDLPA